MTIGIASFGSWGWFKLAQERALPSADLQGVPVVHHHAATLADARNEILGVCSTEWLIYLDADDELEPGYVEALGRGTADMRAPAVRYVRDGKLARPRIPRVAGHHHPCTADCLPAGNWLVIGTAVRAELARRAGGWRDFPVYEDWDYFLRCHLAGASVEAVPDAIYRAHVREDSRNRGMPVEERNRWHREIVAALPFASGGVVSGDAHIHLDAGCVVHKP